MTRPLPARVRIADGSIRDGCTGTATRRLRSGRLYVALDGLVYDGRPLFCAAREVEVEWLGEESDGESEGERGMTKRKFRLDDWENYSVEALGQFQASPATNATAHIANLSPHYTNDYFRQARTVYLAQGHKLTGDSVKGAEYNYSDRIWQWDHAKAEAAHVTAKASGFNDASAAYCEVFLRAYFDRPSLALVHILAGFNVSNGYPYQVFGYFPNGNEQKGRTS